MFQLSCFVFLCLLVVAYGQNCNQEIDKFRDCVRQKRQDQQKVSSKEHEGDQSKKKEEIRQCFIKNQCKEPKFETSPSQSGKGGRGKGADNDKRRQCLKQIEDKARPIVEKCVQAKQPDFHFPTPEKDHQMGEKQGKGGHLGNIGKTINDSCPTEISRQNVKKCLHDSFQKGGSTGDKRQQAETRFTQTCQNRATCFKGMSAQCQTKFNESKTIVCNCVQELMKTSKPQYEQEYNTCTGESAQAPLSNGNGHQKGSGVDSMVKKMCNTKDYCKQSFQSKSQGKGGHNAGASKSNRAHHGTAKTQSNLF